MLSMLLSCRKCGWRTVCGFDDAVNRLRLIGLLRREKQPDEATVAELLLDAAPRMTCPVCREKKTLRGEPISPSELPPDEWDDDWQAAALCEMCREPIPPERLEALPGATRCITCQQQTERGLAVDDELEFCPKCGALMELRVSSRGGLTRYKMFCTGQPSCRL